MPRTKKKSFPQSDDSKQVPELDILHNVEQVESKIEKNTQL